MAAVDTHDRLLTTDEVAEHFRVTRRTIEIWRRKGILPAPARIARTVRWRRADLDAVFSAARLVTPTESTRCG